MQNLIIASVAPSRFQRKTYNDNSFLFLSFWLNKGSYYSRGSIGGIGIKLGIDDAIVTEINDDDIDALVTWQLKVGKISQQKDERFLWRENAITRNGAKRGQEGPCSPTKKKQKKRFSLPTPPSSGGKILAPPLVMTLIRVDHPRVGLVANQ